MAMRSPSTPKDRTAPGKITAATVRLDRQKAALKANMARRKAQAQARNAEETSSGETEETGKGGE
jgi:hypothetical protein